MAATQTTLVNFPYITGSGPGLSDLIADSDGDLFGVAPVAPNNEGEDNGLVFEIAKTAGGYASTPTTLASFDDGVPQGSLIADANGDLFGMTGNGGENDDGTVFEIAKTPTGYASAPTTLASLNAAQDASEPHLGLIADAEGDLFGTTFEGGANGVGTVFKVAKTLTGYASAPATLVSFVRANTAFPPLEFPLGAFPVASLIADAKGDLFGI